MRSLFSVQSAFLAAALCSGTAIVAQQGSGPYYGANGGYGQRPYSQQYAYGQPQYADDPGYRRGFDDGMRSGQSDLQSGKRSDPAKSENYEDAPGYNSSFGDKGQWKQQYRQGYISGYQRAVNGGSWRGQGQYGQSQYGQGPGVYGGSQYSEAPGYQHGFDDGMRSGQTDVQQGKRGDPTKSESYEDAPGYNSSFGDKGQWKEQYRQGYTAGYQSAINGGYGRRQGQYGQGQYGGGGYGQPQYAQDPGYQRGFADGIRSGQSDVQRGKRSDPTKSENYEDAPGYNSSFGDKGQWTQQYRQGYTAGYQQAMDGGADGGYGQPYDQRGYGGTDQRGYGQTQDSAYRRGFDDGIRSGQRDAQNGNQNDPTRSAIYGDAPGYDSSYGDRGRWRQHYREGYIAGYEQAQGRR